MFLNLLLNLCAMTMFFFCFVCLSRIAFFFKKQICVKICVCVCVLKRNQTWSPSPKAEETNDENVDSQKEVTEKKLTQRDFALAMLG